MRKIAKMLTAALLVLFCVALASCGFVNYVRNPDASLEATKEEYIALLRTMGDESNYFEEQRREYLLTLIEVENLIREADSLEDILSIFEEYSQILGNIPLSIELTRTRIFTQMKELATANAYRAEQQVSVDWLLEHYKGLLDECNDIDGCDTLLLKFKTTLSNIKTDAQLYAEELYALKKELSLTFGEAVDYSLYRAEQRDELEKTVKEFQSVVAGAKTHEECHEIFADYVDRMYDVLVAAVILANEKAEWVDNWNEKLYDFAQRYSLDIENEILATLLLIIEQDSENAANLCGSSFILETIEKNSQLKESALDDMLDAALVYVSSVVNESDYRTKELETLRAAVGAAKDEISAAKDAEQILAKLESAEQTLLAIPTNDELWADEDESFAEYMSDKYESLALIPPESLTVANSVEELARIIDYYAFYQLDGNSFERATFRVELNYSHKYAEWIIRDVYWCCELLRSAVGISGEFDGDSSNLIITLHPYDIATVTNKNRLEGAQRKDSLIEYDTDKDYTDRAEDFEAFPYLELYSGRYVKVWNSQQLWYALEKEYIPVPVENSPAEEVLLAAEEILREIIKDGMTIEEKVFAIYSWYSDNLTYDYEYENYMVVENRENFPDSKAATLRSFHAEGALLDKLSVCCGYAKSTLILMRMEGIESYRVILHLYEENAIDNLGDPFYGSHAIITFRASNDKFYYCDTEQCADGDSLKYEKYMQVMVTAKEQTPYNSAIDRIWQDFDYGEKFPFELLWDNLTYNGKSLFVKKEKDLKEILDDFCKLGDTTKQINIFTHGTADFDVGEFLDADPRIEYYCASYGGFYEYMISYVGETE